MQEKIESLKPGEQSALENMADGRLGLIRDALIGANGLPAALITEAIPSIAEGLAFAYEGMLIDAIKDSIGKSTSRALRNTSTEVQAKLMTKSDVANLTNYLTREKTAIEVFISAGIPDDAFLMQLVAYRVQIFKALYEEILNSRVNVIFRDKNKRVMPNATTLVSQPATIISSANEMSQAATEGESPEQAASMPANVVGSLSESQVNQPDSSNRQTTSVDRFLASTET